MRTLLLSALALSACATTAVTTSPTKTTTMTFVLVHGAFADSHAFDAVKPLLEAQGHRVLAPDLPGHGADTTPSADITLERYVDSVKALVEAQNQPVVLVGHSLAGMVVSQVAERAPTKVKQVIFVAAYLPQNGQSLEDLAKGDPTSLVGQNLQFAPDYSTVTIKREALAQALAADLPAQVQFIVAGHKPEPLAPFRGKAVLTTERFGSVPRAYLLTSNDRAVTPALQRQMLAAWPTTQTVELATSHLPFLAQPEAWVTAVLRLANN